MDDAQHCTVDESSTRMSKLDRLEVKLFKGGQVIHHLSLIRY